MRSNSLQQRRRFKHKLSLEDRLLAQAARLREEAKALPPGIARDSILVRAEEVEAAASMSQWLNVPAAKRSS